jgi:hypothetical protein
VPPDHLHSDSGKHISHVSARLILEQVDDFASVLLKKPREYKGYVKLLNVWNFYFKVYSDA